MNLSSGALGMCDEIAQIVSIDAAQYDFDRIGNTCKPETRLPQGDEDWGGEKGLESSSLE